MLMVSSTNHHTFLQLHQSLSILMTVRKAKNSNKFGSNTKPLTAMIILITTRFAPTSKNMTLTQYYSLASHSSQSK